MRLSGILNRWPWFIFCLALTLRLWGISWQLPALLYPDELKYAGWAGAVADNHPPVRSDFRNPSLYRHLLLLEYRLSDALDPLPDARDRAVHRTALARVTSAGLGAGAAVLTGLAAARVFGPFHGVIASLILAVGPLPVHLSHFAVNDASALFFLAASLYAGVRAWAELRWHNFLLAGLCAGLATAGKYNFGFIGLMPLLCLIEFVAQRRMRFSAALGLGSIAVVAGLVGLLVAMPEIVTATAAVRDGMEEQAAMGAQASFDQQETPVAFLYLESGARGLGLPAIVFALLGAMRIALARRALAPALLVCPLIYLVVMLRSELFAARFALPLLPFAAVLAAHGVHWAGNRWRSALVRRAMFTVCIAAIVIPAGLAVVQHNTLAMTRDTRLLARDWLRDHAGRANVAAQSFSTPIFSWGPESAGDYELFRFESLESPTMANRLACQNTRYVVLSNFWYERDLKSGVTNRALTGYDWVFQNGELIETISPYREGHVAPAHPDDIGIPFWFMTEYARPGPRIEIWQLPDDIQSLCAKKTR